MSKSERVLGLLPAVYRARAPGKLLGEVVDALVAPLEEADTHLFRIQRAHRLLVAEQPEDIVRLAALLNLTHFHFEDLLANRAVSSDERLRLMRDRVQRIARLHLRGLGTPLAIIEAAAIFLNAQAVPDSRGESVVKHLDTTGYVHRATIEWPATQKPAPEITGAPRSQVYLYENPLRRKKLEPTARWPFDTWPIENSSLESAPVALAITGVGERTVCPSLISADLAEGVYFNGIVPDGRTLVFDRAGGALLDGRPVDDWLVRLSGGAWDLASYDESSDGAGFSITEGGRAPEPFDGELDRLSTSAYRSWPPVLMLARGGSRWNFAVAEGVWDGSDFDYAVYTTEHLPIAVFEADNGFDGCVFDCPPSGIIAMAWDERIPCAFKLVLPRQAAMASAAVPAANYRGRVSAVLPRFKAAGIRAYVDEAREAWVLAESRLPAAQGAGAASNVLMATRIWAPFAEGFVALDEPA